MTSHRGIGNVRMFQFPCMVFVKVFNFVPFNLLRHKGAQRVLSSFAHLRNWFNDCHVAKKHFDKYFNKTFWTILCDVLIDHLRNYLRVIRSSCSADIGHLKLVYFLAILGPTSSSSVSNLSTDIR